MREPLQRAVWLRPITAATNLALVLGAAARADESAPTVQEAHAFLGHLASDGLLQGGWNRRFPVARYYGSGCFSRFTLDLHSTDSRLDSDKSRVAWNDLKAFQPSPGNISLRPTNSALAFNFTSDGGSAVKTAQMAQALFKACAGK